MIKQILLAVALCVGVAAQTSQGGVTSKGGSIQSAPYGTHHNLALADTDGVADTLGAHLISHPTLFDSLATGESVTVHKIFRVGLAETVRPSDALVSHHGLKLNLVESLKPSDQLAIAYTAIRRPTLFADNGVNQDGVAAPCQNQMNAFDGDINTFVGCIANFNPVNGHFLVKDLIYYGFGIVGGGPSQIALNITSTGSIDANCTGGSDGITYSLNGGTNWNLVPEQQGVYAKRTDQIILSPGQDLTQVEVRVRAECDGSNNGALARAENDTYEIFIKAQ